MDETPIETVLKCSHAAIFGPSSQSCHVDSLLVGFSSAPPCEGFTAEPPGHSTHACHQESLKVDFTSAPLGEGFSAEPPCPDFRHVGWFTYSVLEPNDAIEELRPPPAPPILDASFCASAAMDSTHSAGDASVPVGHVGVHANFGHDVGTQAPEGCDVGIQIGCGLGACSYGAPAVTTEVIKIKLEDYLPVEAVLAAGHADVFKECGSTLASRIQCEAVLGFLTAEASCPIASVAAGLHVDMKDELHEDFCRHDSSIEKAQGIDYARLLVHDESGAVGSFRVSDESSTNGSFSDRTHTDVYEISANESILDRMHIYEDGSVALDSGGGGVGLLSFCEAGCAVGAYLYGGTVFLAVEETFTSGSQSKFSKSVLVSLAVLLLALAFSDEIWAFMVQLRRVAVSCVRFCTRWLLAFLGSMIFGTVMISYLFCKHVCSAAVIVPDGSTLANSIVSEAADAPEVSLGVVPSPSGCAFGWRKPFLYGIDVSAELKKCALEHLCMRGLPASVFANVGNLMNRNSDAHAKPHNDGFEGGFSALGRNSGCSYKKDGALQVSKKQRPRKCPAHVKELRNTFNTMGGTPVSGAQVQDMLDGTFVSSSSGCPLSVRQEDLDFHEAAEGVQGVRKLGSERQVETEQSGSFWNQCACVIERSLQDQEVPVCALTDETTSQLPILIQYFEWLIQIGGKEIQELRDCIFVLQSVAYLPEKIQLRGVLAALEMFQELNTHFPSPLTESSSSKLVQAVSCTVKAGTPNPRLDRANCLNRTSEPQRAACSGKRGLDGHVLHGYVAQGVVNRTEGVGDVWSDESPINNDKLMS